MNIISIKPREAVAEAFVYLEKKGLIKVLRPTAKVINTRAKTGAVDVYYRCGKKYGGHCLLGVGKRNTEIQFSFHPENEDLILLRPGANKYKDLFFVVSLLKRKAFIKALKEEKLRSRDFTAVKLEFNDPGTMFFTVLKNTVHCEVTAPGGGQHPIFFVTEPSKLRMNRISTNKFKFCLSGQRG